MAETLHNPSPDQFMSIILKILIMVSLAEYQNNKHWEREWEQAEKEALEAERLEAQAAEEE